MKVVLTLSGILHWRAVIFDHAGVVCGTDKRTMGLRTHPLHMEEGDDETLYMLPGDEDEFHVKTTFRVQSQGEVMTLLVADLKGRLQMKEVHCLGSVELQNPREAP